MRAIKRLLLVAILCAVAACNESTPTPVQQSTDGYHLLVSAQGDLALKRQDWTTYAPTLVGTQLRRGDLLRLDPSAQVIVVCADLTLGTVEPGISGVPCDVQEPVLVHQGSRIIAPRSVPVGEFPTVISPRKTKLISSRPTLRWTPVRGATAYTISLSGPEGRQVIAKDIPSTELIYPESAPSLVPGQPYKVIVEANNRSSEEDKTPDLGFTVLQLDEAQQVHDREASIHALGLEPAPEAIVLANLYADRNLFAEAIEHLGQLSSSPAEPVMERMLGDIYLGTALSHIAETHYLRALQLSESAKDIEGQALAQNALGLIYEAAGNKPDAVLRFQNALELYGKVGDAPRIKEIEEQLKKLK